MAEKYLHIVSFNIPYPANYGGVIDVFYKILWLKRLGLKIHLHCFEYGRSHAPELDEVCDKVSYYKRDMHWISSLSVIPFIVKSRYSDQLLVNLLKDAHPILFEGLHSCYFMNHPRLQGRFLIYRESNIEHEYYFHLFKSEKSLLKKLYFLSEALKLKVYESVLKKASLILPVSREDAAYFEQQYPGVRTVYLPSFHPADDVQVKLGKGSYVLYHGNLEVAENAQAAEYLVKEVFRDLEVPFVIAGLNPSAYLEDLIRGMSGITLIPNPSDEELRTLITEAQINVLVTFQPTGLKLKLLNVLFNGRYCLVNANMLAGTGLERACVIADTADELKEQVKTLFVKEFPESEIDERTALLKDYFNKEKAEKLVRLIFE